MSRSDDVNVAVVIAGAGPIGLLSAIELTLGGVSVLVLERLPAINPLPKALGIGPVGSEALQRRGMGAAIDAAEAHSQAVMRQFAEKNGADPRSQVSKFSGHFAGMSLIRRDAQQEPQRRPRLADQQSVEAMLGERARALGIEVRRECEITGFAQRDDGVDVEWSNAAGAGRIRCAYLIGCDGGRSLVRKLSGFDFPGTAPSMTMYQTVAVIDHPERLQPPGWRRTPGGVFSYGPFPGRLFMLDFSGPPQDRQAPLTAEEVEAVLRRISGADVRVQALQNGSRWTDNTRLVDSYRRGRVLLAGDAAHIHSPFGGQGLSLGLADAANLGWKLAAVIRGEMPDSLLDSYGAERRPVAEAVLANTLAQVAIMRPDPQAGAMRELVADLLQLDQVNQRIGAMMSGLATRYDLGSELDAVGRLIGDRPVRHGDTEVPLYELMQDGRAVLLDASSGQQASALVAAATPRIRCVAVDNGPSLLIRPDACVAWASEDHGVGGLEQALHRWFIAAVAA